MPHSYVRYAGTGSQRQFTFAFPFLARGHVGVTVNGGAAAFGWIHDGLVELAVAPPAGAAVEIRRTTPRGVFLTDFNDASTLVEADLDRSGLQNFYLVQEALDDGAALGARIDTLDGGGGDTVVAAGDYVERSDAVAGTVAADAILMGLGDTLGEDAVQRLRWEAYDGADLLANGEIPKMADLTDRVSVFGDTMEGALTVIAADLEAGVALRNENDAGGNEWRLIAKDTGHAALTNETTNKELLVFKPDGGIVFPQAPLAGLSKSSYGAVSNGATFALVFEGNRNNLLSLSGSNTLVTLPTAGYYAINATCTVSNSGTIASWDISLYLNGVQIDNLLEGFGLSGARDQVSIFVFEASAGDTISFKAHKTGSGTLIVEYFACVLEYKP